jgi:hypothetical protein
MNHSTIPDVDATSFPPASTAPQDITAIWEAMTHEERLEMILEQLPAEQWFEEYAFDELVDEFPDKRSWGHIKARFQLQGGKPYDLDCAAKQVWHQLIAQAAVASACAPSPAPVPPRTTPQSACDLYRKDLPELPYVIDEILPIGATLFVGRAKDGKSLMIWNLCMAITTGGLALGKYPAPQGRVHNLAL